MASPRDDDLLLEAAGTPSPLTEAERRFLDDDDTDAGMPSEARAIPRASTKASYDKAVGDWQIGRAAQLVEGGKTDAEARKKAAKEAEKFQVMPSAQYDEDVYEAATKDPSDWDEADVKLWSRGRGIRTQSAPKPKEGETYTEAHRRELGELFVDTTKALASGELTTKEALEEVTEGTKQKAHELYDRDFVSDEMKAIVGFSDMLTGWAEGYTVGGVDLELGGGDLGRLVGVEPKKVSVPKFAVNPLAYIQPGPVEEDVEEAKTRAAQGYRALTEDVEWLGGIAEMPAVLEAMGGYLPSEREKRDGAAEVTKDVWKAASAAGRKWSAPHLGSVQQAELGEMFGGPVRRMRVAGGVDKAFYDAVTTWAQNDYTNNDTANRVLGFFAANALTPGVSPVLHAALQTETGREWLEEKTATASAGVRAFSFDEQTQGLSETAPLEAFEDAVGAIRVQDLPAEARKDVDPDEIIDAIYASVEAGEEGAALERFAAIISGLEDKDAIRDVLSGRQVDTGDAPQDELIDALNLTKVGELPKRVRDLMVDRESVLAGIGARQEAREETGGEEMDAAMASLGYLMMPGQVESTIGKLMRLSDAAPQVFLEADVGLAGTLGALTPGATGEDYDTWLRSVIPGDSDVEGLMMDLRLPVLPAYVGAGGGLFKSGWTVLPALAGLERMLESEHIGGALVDYKGYRAGSTWEARVYSQLHPEKGRAGAMEGLADIMWGLGAKEQGWADSAARAAGLFLDFRAPWEEALAGAPIAAARTGATGYQAAKVAHRFGTGAAPAAKVGGKVAWSQVAQALPVSDRMKARLGGTDGYQALHSSILAATAAAEASGKSWLDSIHPSARQSVQTAFEKLGVEDAEGNPVTFNQAAEASRRHAAWLAVRNLEKASEVLQNGTAQDIAFRQEPEYQAFRAALDQAESVGRLRRGDGAVYLGVVEALARLLEDQGAGPSHADVLRALRLRIAGDADQPQPGALRADLERKSAPTFFSTVERALDWMKDDRSYTPQAIRERLYSGEKDHAPWGLQEEVLDRRFAVSKAEAAEAMHRDPNLDLTRVGYESVEEYVDATHRVELREVESWIDDAKLEPAAATALKQRFRDSELGKDGGYGKEFLKREIKRILQQDTRKFRSGIRKEEVDWLGLSEWLDELEGKVTGKQVREYLDAWKAIYFDDVLDTKPPATEGMPAGWGFHYATEEGYGYWVLAAPSNEVPQAVSEASARAGFVAELDVGLEVITADDTAAAALASAKEMLKRMAEEPDSFAVEPDEVEGVRALARAVEPIRVTEDTADGPQYASMQSPGGENYREILVRLQTPERAAYEAHRGELWKKYGRFWRQSATNEEMGRSRELGVAMDEKPGFDGGHFEQHPDTLFHLRVKDYIDDEGRRVLYVDELQSDWQKAVRERGARPRHGEETRRDVLERTALNGGEAIGKMPDLMRTMNVAGVTHQAQLLLFGGDAYAGRGRRAYHRVAPRPRWDAAWEAKVRSQFAEWGLEAHADKAIADARELVPRVDAWDELQGLGRETRVPEPPHKASWHELAVKKLLRMAVEQGYDRLAISHSDVQVQRWGEDYKQGYIDLYDKQVPKFLNKTVKKWGTKVEADELSVGASKRTVLESDPDVRVPFLPYIGGTALMADMVHKRELLGHEMAGRFTQLLQRQSMTHPTQQPDLDVIHGQIREEYRDKVVALYEAQRASLEGHGYGDTVAIDELTAAVNDPETAAANFIQTALTTQDWGGHGEPFIVLDEYGRRLYAAETREGADDLAMWGSKPIKVWAIDITDKMVESVLYEGQPLFMASKQKVPARPFYSAVERALGDLLPDRRYSIEHVRSKLVKGKKESVSEELLEWAREQEFVAFDRVEGSDEMERVPGKRTRKQILHRLTETESPALRAELKARLKPKKDYTRGEFIEALVGDKRQFRPGIKREEVDWMDLDDWLQGRSRGEVQEGDTVVFNGLEGVVEAIVPKGHILHRQGYRMRVKVTGGGKTLQQKAAELARDPSPEAFEFFRATLNRQMEAGHSLSGALGVEVGTNYDIKKGVDVRLKYGNKVSGREVADYVSAHQLVVVEDVLSTAKVEVTGLPEGWEWARRATDDGMGETTGGYLQIFAPAHEAGGVIDDISRSSVGDEHIAMEKQLRGLVPVIGSYVDDLAGPYDRPGDLAKRLQGIETESGTQPFADIPLGDLEVTVGAKPQDGPQYAGAVSPGGENYRELLVRVLTDDEAAGGHHHGYYGDHYGGVRNLLFHVRAQDYIVDGKRILWVDELQSDWQKAAKDAADDEGYISPKRPLATSKREASVKAIADEAGVARPGVVAVEAIHLLEQVDGLVRADRRVDDQRVQKVHRALGELVRVADSEIGLRPFHEFGTGPEDWRGHAEELLLEAFENEVLAQEAMAILEAQVPAVQRANSVSMGDRASRSAPPGELLPSRWHELAVKKVLHRAAVEGYDEVRFSGSEVQTQRWGEDYKQGYINLYDKQVPRYAAKYGKKWGVKVTSETFTLDQESGGYHIVDNRTLPRLPSVGAEQRGRHHAQLLAAKVRLNFPDDPAGAAAHYGGEIDALYKRVERSMLDEISVIEGYGVSDPNNATWKRRRRLLSDEIDILNDFGGDGFTFPPNSGRKFTLVEAFIENAYNYGELDRWADVHHSNRRPWTIFSEERLATVRRLPSKEDAEGSLQQLAGPRELRGWVVPITDKMRESITTEGQPLFSAPGRQRAKPFYSGVRRALEPIKPERSYSFEYVRALLYKGKGAKKQYRPGVRKDEVDWLGIDTFLDYHKELGQKKVRGEDLLWFVGANQPRAREITLGPKWDDASVMDESAPWASHSMPGGENYRMFVLRAEPILDSRNGMLPADQARFREMEKELDEARLALSRGTHKHREEALKARGLEGAEDHYIGGRFVEPGKIQIDDPFGRRSTRVVEVEGLEPTVPDSRDPDAPTYVVGHQVHVRAYRTGPGKYFLLEHYEKTPEGAAARARWDKAYEVGAQFFDEAEARAAAAGVRSLGKFMGSVGHTRNPNALFHVRTKDFIDTDGKRVLLIDEVQSDWHQQGRKKGYSGPEAVAAKAQLDALRAERLELQNEILAIQGQADPDMQGRLREIDGLIDEQREKAFPVPNAPFRDGVWWQFALKQMLRKAAEGNYDRVSITPGVFHAERYDLGGHVRRIWWNPRAGMFYAEPLQGGMITLRDANGRPASPENLSEFINQEPADRLRAKMEAAKTSMEGAAQGHPRISWDEEADAYVVVRGDGTTVSDGMGYDEHFEDSGMALEALDELLEFEDLPRRPVLSPLANRLLEEMAESVNEHADVTTEAVATYFDNNWDFWRAQNIEEAQLFNGLSEAQATANADGIGAELEDHFAWMRRHRAESTFPAVTADVEIRGDDLKVSPKGYTGFYDKMLPKWLNKYTKKWGTKTKPTVLKHGQKAAPAGELQVRGQLGNGMYTLHGNTAHELELIAERSREVARDSNEAVNLSGQALEELEKAVLDGNDPDGDVERYLDRYADGHSAGTDEWSEAIWSHLTDIWDEFTGIVDEGRSVRWHDDTWSVFRDEERIGFTVETEVEAREELRQLQEGLEVQESPDVTVWSVDITDKMRESVLYDGQSLWHKDEAGTVRGGFQVLQGEKAKPALTPVQEDALVAFLERTDELDDGEPGHVEEWLRFGREDAAGMFDALGRDIWRLDWDDALFDEVEDLTAELGRREGLDPDGEDDLWEALREKTRKVVERDARGRLLSEISDIQALRVAPAPPRLVEAGGASRYKGAPWADHAYGARGALLRQGARSLADELDVAIEKHDLGAIDAMVDRVLREEWFGLTKEEASELLVASIKRRGVDIDGLSHEAAWDLQLDWMMLNDAWFRSSLTQPLMELRETMARYRPAEVGTVETVRGEAQRWLKQEGSSYYDADAPEYRQHLARGAAHRSAPGLPPEYLGQPGWLREEARLIEETGFDARARIREEEGRHASTTPAEMVRRHDEGELDLPAPLEKFFRQWDAWSRKSDELRREGSDRFGGYAISRADDGFTIGMEGSGLGDRARPLEAFIRRTYPNVEVDYLSSGKVRVRLTETEPSWVPTRKGPPPEPSLPGRETKAPIDESPDTVGGVHFSMGLAEAEDAIRSQTNEVLVAYDPAGGQVGRVQGTRSNVPFSEALHNALQEIKALLTHNHPRESGPSYPDTLTAITYGLSEMRATMPGGGHWRLIAPPDGWPLAWVTKDIRRPNMRLDAELEVLFDSILDGATDRMDARVASPPPDAPEPPDGYPHGYDHDTWVRFQRDAAIKNLNEWLEERAPGAVVYDVQGRGLQGPERAPAAEGRGAAGRPDPAVRPEEVEPLPENVIFLKGGGREWGALPLEDAVAWVDANMDPARVLGSHELMALDSWSGDTILRKDDGSLIVLFHGTAMDVDVFKPSTRGFFGPGTYLSTNPTDASHYARSDGKRATRDTLVDGDGEDPWATARPAAPNVMPLYARLENPLHSYRVPSGGFVADAIKNVQALLEEYPDGVDEVLQRRGRDKTRKWTHEELKKAVDYTTEVLESIPEMVERGENWVSQAFQYRDRHYDPSSQGMSAPRVVVHDALYKAGIDNDYDGIFVARHDRGADHVVVWSQNQVKSAIGNKGTYSRTDDAILEAGGRAYRPLAEQKRQLRSLLDEAGWPDAASKARADELFQVLANARDMAKIDQAGRELQRLAGKTGERRSESLLLKDAIYDLQRRRAPRHEGVGDAPGTRPYGAVDEPVDELDFSMLESGGDKPYGLSEVLQSVAAQLGVDIADLSPADVEASYNRSGLDAPETLERALRAMVSPGRERGAFRRWFGESKVVDEEGEPAVYWKAMIGEVPHVGVDGVELTFASSSRDVAENFASINGEGWASPGASGAPPGVDVRPRAIQQVYVHAEKPFDFRNATDREWLIREMSTPEAVAAYNAETRSYGDKYAYQARDIQAGIEEGTYQVLEMKYVIDLIRDRGYDAIYVRESAGTPINIGVFNPNQFKSVDNVGTWSGRNIFEQGADSLYSPVTARVGMTAYRGEYPDLVRYNEDYKAAIKKGDTEAAEAAKRRYYDLWEPQLREALKRAGVEATVRQSVGGWMDDPLELGVFVEFRGASQTEVEGMLASFGQGFNQGGMLFRHVGDVLEQPTPDASGRAPTMNLNLGQEVTKSLVDKLAKTMAKSGLGWTIDVEKGTISIAHTPEWGAPAADVFIEKANVVAHMVAKVVKKQYGVDVATVWTRESITVAEPEARTTGGHRVPAYYELVEAWRPGLRPREGVGAGRGDGAGPEPVRPVAPAEDPEGRGPGAELRDGGAGPEAAGDLRRGAPGEVDGGAPAAARGPVGGGALGASRRPVGTGEVEVPRGFRSAEPAEFLAARAEHTRDEHLAMLSPLEEGDLAGRRAYLSDDGQVGFVLDAENDLQNVFSGRTGGGVEALFSAIEMGAASLDCFDGFLPGYYKSFGFVETERLTWDDQYAPAGWNYDKFRRPDVVMMRWEGGNRASVRDRWQKGEPLPAGATPFGMGRHVDRPGARPQAVAAKKMKAELVEARKAGSMSPVAFDEAMKRLRLDDSSALVEETFTVSTPFGDAAVSLVRTDGYKALIPGGFDGDWSYPDFDYNQRRPIWFDLPLDPENLPHRKWVPASKSPTGERLEGLHQGLLDFKDRDAALRRIWSEAGVPKEAIDGALKADGKDVPAKVKEAFAAVREAQEDLRISLFQKHERSMGLSRHRPEPAHTPDGLPTAEYAERMGLHAIELASQYLFAMLSPQLNIVKNQVVGSIAAVRSRAELSALTDKARPLLKELEREFDRLSGELEGKPLATAKRKAWQRFSQQSAAMLGFAVTLPQAARISGESLPKKGGRWPRAQAERITGLTWDDLRAINRAQYEKDLAKAQKAAYAADKVVEDLPEGASAADVKEAGDAKLEAWAEVDRVEQSLNTVPAPQMEEGFALQGMGDPGFVIEMLVKVDEDLRAFEDGKRERLFFEPHPDEPWGSYMTRLTSNLRGMAPKIAAFAGLGVDLERATWIPVDIYMLREYGHKVAGSKQALSALQKIWYAKWQAGEGHRQSGGNKKGWDYNQKNGRGADRTWEEELQRRSKISYRRYLKSEGVVDWTEHLRDMVTPKAVTLPSEGRLQVTLKQIASARRKLRQAETPKSAISAMQKVHRLERQRLAQQYVDIWRKQHPDVDLGSVLPTKPNGKYILQVPTNGYLEVIAAIKRDPAVKSGRLGEGATMWLRWDETRKVHEPEPVVAPGTFLMPSTRARMERVDAELKEAGAYAEPRHTKRPGQRPYIETVDEAAEPQGLYATSPAGEVEGTFHIEQAAQLVITLFREGNLDTLFHEAGHLLEYLLGPQHYQELVRNFEHISAREADAVWADVQSGVDDATAAQRHGLQHDPANGINDVDSVRVRRSRGGTGAVLTTRGREQAAESLRWYLRLKTAPDGRLQRVFDRTLVGLQQAWMRVRRGVAPMLRQQPPSWSRMDPAESGRPAVGPVDAATKPEEVPKPLLSPEMTLYWDRLLRPDLAAYQEAVVTVSGDPEVRGRMQGVTVSPSRAVRIEEGRPRSAGVRQEAARAEYRPEVLMQELGLQAGDQIGATELLREVMANAAVQKFREVWGGEETQRLTTRTVVPKSRVRAIHDEVVGSFQAHIGLSPSELAARADAQLGDVRLNPLEQGLLRNLAHEVAREPMGNPVPDRLLDPTEDLTYVRLDEINALQEAAIDVAAGVGGHRSRRGEAVPHTVMRAFMRTLNQAAERLAAQGDGEGLLDEVAAPLAGAVLEAKAALESRFIVTDETAGYLDPGLRELVDTHLRGLEESHYRLLRLLRDARENGHASLRAGMTYVVGQLSPPVDPSLAGVLLAYRQWFRGTETMSAWAMLDTGTIAALRRLLMQGHGMTPLESRSLAYLDSMRGPNRPITADEAVQIGESIANISDGIERRWSTVKRRAQEITIAAGGQVSDPDIDLSGSAAVERYELFYRGQWEHIWDRVNQARGRHAHRRFDKGQAATEMVLRMMVNEQLGELSRALAEHGLDVVGHARDTAVGERRVPGSERAPLGTQDREAFRERTLFYINQIIQWEDKPQFARGTKRATYLPDAPQTAGKPFPEAEAQAASDAGWPRDELRNVHDMLAYREAWRILESAGFKYGKGKWVDHEFPDGSKALLPDMVIKQIDEATDLQAALGKAYAPKAHKPLRDVWEETSGAGDIVQQLFLNGYSPSAAIRMGITTGLLLPNPGYWVNNTFGAILQTYGGSGFGALSLAGYGGTPLEKLQRVRHHHGIVRAVTTRMWGEGQWRATGSGVLVTPDGRMYTADMIAADALRYGLNSSFVKNETIRGIAREIRDQYPEGWRYLMHHPQLWQKTLVESATAIDNYFRVSVYVDGLLQGKSPAEAAEGARLALYDYGQLTEFERKYVRQLVMFYSYMRRNHALWWDVLLTNPSRALGQLRLLHGTAKWAMEPEDEQLAAPAIYEDRGWWGSRDAEEWTRKWRVGWAWPPVPIADWVSTAADLHDSVVYLDEDAMKMTGSRLTPWAQMPITMIGGVDIFRMRDLESADNIPWWLMELDTMGGGHLHYVFDVGVAYEDDPLRRHYRGLPYRYVAGAQGEHEFGGRAWWLFTSMTPLPVAGGRSQDTITKALRMWRPRPGISRGEETWGFTGAVKPVLLDDPTEAGLREMGMQEADIIRQTMEMEIQ
ncbi:MAG: hypothetical protein GY812_16715 [Actinomycetia bacterium]|nr:hypothetical protein [Actinomycetes bacterium]